MIASDAQTSVILHGLVHGEQWEEIPMPVGRQNLPKWMSGLHIDWMMQYANSPHIVFRAKYEPMPEDVLWEQGPKGRYFREHEGIVEQLWHQGPLTCMENGEWQTPKENGFGGRTFTVNLKDGRIVHLRGPWFGGCPEGYSELVVVNTSTKYYEMDQRQGKVKWEIMPGSGRFIHRILKPKAWFKQGGTFGLYISNELLIKAIATYQPHVRIAKWKRSYHVITPFLDEWNMPKEAWIRRKDK